MTIPDVLRISRPVPWFEDEATDTESAYRTAQGEVPDGWWHHITFRWYFWKDGDGRPMEAYDRLYYTQRMRESSVLPVELIVLEVALDNARRFYEERRG